MAASFTIAGRNNGFSKADIEAATRASVTAYREAMAEFAQMPTMDIWYAHLAEDEIRNSIRVTVAQAAKTAKGKKAKQATRKAAKRAEKTAEKTAEKAHTRDSLQALSKLGEVVDGQYRIVTQPPVIVPARDLAPAYGVSARDLNRVIREQFRAYRDSLPDDRRQLLDRFRIVDMARKVVRVGSVGTRAFIVLLQGRDEHDPLFLQVKEATASVLEEHVRKSRYRQPGERVVQGQRIMQAASDIYLGWTKGVQANRYYYWRQLRDMKGSALVESMAHSRSRSTRACAGGRWHGHTPAPATRLPSPSTWATATRSTGRSPTSRACMPTSTNATTRSSRRQSNPGGSRRAQAFENRSETRPRAVTARRIPRERNVLPPGSSERWLAGVEAVVESLVEVDRGLDEGQMPWPAASVSASRPARSSATQHWSRP